MIESNITGCIFHPAVHFTCCIHWETRTPCSHFCCQHNQHPSDAIQVNNLKITLSNATPRHIVTITDLPMMVTHECNDSIDLALYIQICQAICMVMNVLVLPWQQKLFLMWLFFRCPQILCHRKYTVTISCCAGNCRLEIELWMRMVLNWDTQRLVGMSFIYFSTN